MEKTYVLDLGCKNLLRVIATPEEMATLMVVLKASEILSGEAEVVSEKPLEGWIIVEHIETRPGGGKYDVFSGEDYMNDVMRLLLELERKNVPYHIHRAVGIEHLELTPITLRTKIEEESQCP